MDTGVWLQQKVENIVRRGGQVRRGVATAVATAAKSAQGAADGLLGILRTTLDGASRGMGAAAPVDRESILREVVEGLGDGLATTAHAAELTLREVAGTSLRFAREDLDRLADGFAAVSQRFVDSIGEAAASTAGHARSQAGTLRDHAASTLRRIAPVFTAVVDAAKRDPVGLGRETLTAGTGAVRGAAGALFAAVGKKLQDLGANLDPHDTSA